MNNKWSPPRAAHLAFRCGIFQLRVDKNDFYLHFYFTVVYGSKALSNGLRGWRGLE